MSKRQKKTTKCPSFAVFAVGPSVPDPLRLCREVCADKLAGAMDGIATKVDLPGGTVVVAVRSEVDAVLATDIAARLGRSADEIDFERRRLENLYRGIYEDKARDANRAARRYFALLVCTVFAASLLLAHAYTARIGTGAGREQPALRQGAGKAAEKHQGHVARKPQEAGAGGGVAQASPLGVKRIQPGSGEPEHVAGVLVAEDPHPLAADVAPVDQVADERAGNVPTGIDGAENVEDFAVHANSVAKEGEQDKGGAR